MPTKNHARLDETHMKINGHEIDVSNRDKVFFPDAGVTEDLQTFMEWKKLGVKDSKLLTRKKRLKLEKIINKP